MNFAYSQRPLKVVNAANRQIDVFDTDSSDNIDHKVVEEFGEEWTKFHRFSDEEINTDAALYFDILDDKIINQNTYMIDLGCGTGRWTKYLAPKVKFIEAIDPSEAIYVADRLIGKAHNVRLAKASIDNIPFPDETFDFAMSIGVLHHIPDTQKAMMDGVKKVKIGGYFYAYMYYNLENRGPVFKSIFWAVNAVRNVTSRLPQVAKKIVCDILAVTVYLPVVTVGRMLRFVGLDGTAKKLPLAHYQAQTFLWMRTDALDRFGTRLEQRFSRKQITEMMHEAGLSEIKFSDGLPYWHMVAKRVR